MRKPHFEANFNLIDRTDLFICLHIVFKISFQNPKGQKSYGKFFSVGSELLLSIEVGCKGVFITQTGYHDGRFELSVTNEAKCTFICPHGGNQRISS